MSNANPSHPRRTLRNLCLIYFGLLTIWILLYSLYGDGNGYLGLANALAVYFFLPLPVVILIALFKRDFLLITLGLLGFAAFAWLWGGLFWPNLPVEVEGPRLRVMTFNVLGRSGDSKDVIASIQTENADILLLQEVTPEIASALFNSIAEDYPYQIINARPMAAGMAVFSRYPLKEIDIVLDGRWRGEPQLLEIDWNGQPVTLVNFHTLSTGALWPRWVRYTFSNRNQTMSDLASLAADTRGPLIMAGDANSTSLNDSYKAVNAVLADAWKTSGTGLGHTFPGQVKAGDFLTRVSFFLIPHWLVRIDYIFYSDEWQAERTWLAEFNGGSDHRGVVSDLILVSE